MPAPTVTDHELVHLLLGYVEQLRQAATQLRRRRRLPPYVSGVEETRDWRVQAEHSARALEASAMLLDESTREYVHRYGARKP